MATAPQGYQALLRLLEPVGGLALVAAVQHVFGLAMAVALYAVLLRRGAPRWVATLAAAPVLLDAYQLQLEQTIMPDVLFETMIAAGLVVLLWRTAGPWPAGGRGGRAAARRGGHGAGDRRGADRAGRGVRGADRARVAAQLAAERAAGACWRPGASCCRCWRTWPGRSVSPGTSGWPATGRARSTGGRRPRRTAPRSGCPPTSGRCARHRRRPWRWAASTGCCTTRARPGTPCRSRPASPGTSSSTGSRSPSSGSSRCGWPRPSPGTRSGCSRRSGTATRRSRPSRAGSSRTSTRSTRGGTRWPSSPGWRTRTAAAATWSRSSPRPRSCGPTSWAAVTRRARCTRSSASRGWRARCGGAPSCACPACW